jgi:hypothetical protein
MMLSGAYLAERFLNPSIQGQSSRHKPTMQGKAHVKFEKCRKKIPFLGSETISPFAARDPRLTAHPIGPSICSSDWSVHRRRHLVKSEMKVGWQI